MAYFPAPTIFDSSFWEICTEKQQREHCTEAVGLSCCSDNGGVIGNHLCKLRCLLNGACRKCGHSFSRPIFSSCKIIPRFSFAEQLKKYDVLARDRETQLLILGRSAECLPACSLSGLGLDFSFFKVKISPCRPDLKPRREDGCGMHAKGPGEPQKEDSIYTQGQRNSRKRG